MTRVLLVTGSRSLAAIPVAEAWARGLIHAAMHNVDVVVVGDADGPDGWARGIAGGHVLQVRCYLTHGPEAGMISVLTISRDYTAAEWTLTPWTQGSDTHPLRRNAAMVRDAATLAAKGHDVTALALLDGTKRDAPGRRATRGTEHTAALAERAGIVVTRRTWPEGEGR